MSVHGIHSVRVKLESYARTKVASILQPMTEIMLVEQPVDPVAFMIRFRKECVHIASVCFAHCDMAQISCVASN